MNFKALLGSEPGQVHCIGIAGIGVSAVAKLLNAQGVSVSGSDIEETFIVKELRELGIKVFIGHDSANISKDANLVIYTPAATEHNLERVRAKKLGIEQISYPEFLGKLSRDYKTIAITGTHGKSSVTAMTGLILEKAGLDPTVIVGSRVPSFELGNVRVGKGEWLVVEACEYQGNMRYIASKVAVLTSIEKDHLDYYKDLDEIVSAFQEFVNATDKNGVVIYNANDEHCAGLDFGMRLSEGFRVDKLRHISRDAKGGSANWQACEREISSEKQFFEVYYNDKRLGSEWSLQVPGEFNAYNALAAAAAANAVGVKPEVIKKSLSEYKGIWRRFEIVGIMPGIGAHVISDYGHHPTAIRSTLKAVREHFPGHRIVLVYQPHQHNRTKNLFDDFVNELSLADVLIGVEIYDVAGREESNDLDVSTQDIIKKISEKVRRTGDEGPEPELVVYAAGLNEAEELVREHTKEDDVVIVMGAGDIWEVAGRLTE